MTDKNDLLASIAQMQSLVNEFVASANSFCERPSLSNSISARKKLQTIRNISKEMRNKIQEYRKANTVVRRRKRKGSNPEELASDQSGNS